MYYKWDKVFKNGPSKICERQSLKSLKEYCLFKAYHTPSNFLKAVFHKFYLVHFWILCPNKSAIMLSIKKFNLHQLILTNKWNLFKLPDNFKTGISDHHQLIATIMKSDSLKGSQLKKIYITYKNFDINISNHTLKVNLDNIKNRTHCTFLKDISESFKEAGTSEN